MSYYTGNVSNNPMVGDLPDPYYWWQAGALWGAMLDYYHYTGDSSYNPVVLDALLAPANTGPQHDYKPPEHYLELGNDDLGFWGFAVLAAAERNFPQPRPEVPSWLKMAENIFTSLSSRWDDARCGGGVHWQVFRTSPHGIDYKNSVTNGALFQLAARLARATGRAFYADWAVRVWDWSVATGIIGKKFSVYGGAHASDNCAKVNHVSFSYTGGIYLYGAAVMAEHTGDQMWADRANGLLAAAGYFFGQSEESRDVMYEPACEPGDLCNHDMKSLKGYSSRFMWQSTHHMPSLLPEVRRLLEASSLAAAAACSGGDNGVTCGQKWYVGGFDGSVGLGQQMYALETIQGLLSTTAKPPRRQDEIVNHTDASVWGSEPTEEVADVAKAPDDGMSYTSPP
ncbi:mannan endo-1,6-alpha-mannosidase DCW1 [Plectosphaerella plurivora]|uniref:mannan endo-1,6-alpha-mannosidase n=1 Tax=Plectosphaerella plurivora TaxID=936078 RepID=A0A9P8VHU6_9PEZI|nr:mannan endo-1,6-alpha-mannosidase DCW1 [Plectosphaerella plurivora]